MTGSKFAEISAKFVDAPAELAAEAEGKLSLIVAEPCKAVVALCRAV